MKRKLLSLISLVLLIPALSFKAAGQDLPSKPEPPRLVNDLAGMLSRDEVYTLEQRLVAFNDSTTTQIAIVTVPDLMGYDKGDYAQRLAEKWGIGQKGKNNGILILVKPKQPDSRGEVFIAPGYGLEGVIPDIVCAQIVDNDILPEFRKGNYYDGLSRATSTLMALARGEFTAGQYMKKSGKGGGKHIPIGLLVIIIFFIIMIAGRHSGGSNRRNIGSGSSSLPLWVLLSMMNSGRDSHSGSWGGFSGGGGGGGFGGFGGGSFGGGGAGGSW